MKLWLVRHAAVRVADGVCYGRSDVQAEPAATLAAARALAANLPRAIALRHSPLQRCEQLTQRLCGLRADLSPKADARLAEMDFGTWEGRSWSDIGRAALTAWTDDFSAHRPGGGEPVAGLMARVAQAVDDAVAAHHDCVWITHAGVIRAASLISRGIRSLERADQWPAQPHAFGAWQVLEF